MPTRRDARPCVSPPGNENRESRNESREMSNEKQVPSKTIIATSNNTKMRKVKITAIIIALFSSTFGYTQNKQTEDIQTIFGRDKGFGGFIEFNSHYTEIAGKETIMLGAGLDMVFGHSFNLGVKGYGLVTPVYVPNESFDRKQILMGYGGFNLEPVLFSNSAIHVTFPVLLGVGGIAKVTPYSYYNDYEDQYDEIDYYNSDVFLVAEPGVMLELNLLKFMRISGGASYRITDGVDIEGMSNNALDGINYDVSLKFGIF